MADTTLLRPTASLVGITSTLMLSGFNISTSTLFVPLMYKLDKQTSARMFDRLYHDGIKVVVPLAAAGITSFGYLAYTSPSPSPSPVGGVGVGVGAGVLGTGLSKSLAFSVAAGLVVATLAWTRVVVMPVNERLISVAREVGAKDKVSAGDVEALLRRWWWMNYVRGAGALAAGVLALAASL
ncbi:hypothetical protein INS49_015045 [Diaporthe citri]|uniref:uncharacterized protein n=1 Tax=Diaporthe citri TaxID=83186 RepID=UPI001C7F7095|nr:uncharacterized protein INS49_015045 [Diaporthe citri]KAG6357168.1 hypothetical protein INS49_015045 [Diaporthe citri]